MTRTNGVQHSGGHARRAALSQTVGVKEKSVRNVRSRKVRQRITCFLHWSTASRSTTLSRSRASRSKNISVDESKRDAAARRCFDGTDFLSIDRKIAALSKTSVSGFVTTSSEEASLLIWSRQGCQSEETQFPIATPAICGPLPKSWGTASSARQSQHRWKRVPVAWTQNWHQSCDVSSDGVRPCQHVLLSQHRSHTTCRRNCSTTSFPNKLNHGNGWSRIEIKPVIQHRCVRITRSCHCPRHLNLKVMGRFGLSWHVLSGHSVWHGVQILRASRRNAQSNRIAVVIRSTPNQS